MFGSRGVPLASSAVFADRLREAFLLWISVIVIALLIGMAGYHWIAGESLVDAFLDASMILGGMGQVSRLDGNASKIFAGSYALVAGLAVIGATAVVISPILHRMLHRFHLDDQDLASSSNKDS